MMYGFRMNVETLRLYCRVVQEKSFSRGAARCGVTQPAASQALRQLEEELRVALLDRSKRPFEVTEEGHRFYEACRRLLGEFDQVCAEISRGIGEVHGQVHVAAIYSVGLHQMGAYMQKFRSLYPQARVRLECLHPEKVVQTVLDDAADVGLLSYPPRHKALRVVPFREEPMFFVSHPGHPLAFRHTVGLKDLQGEPFVAFDADLPIRSALDRVFRRTGVSVNVVMEFDNVESIKEALFLDTWVSILPGSAVQNERAMNTLAVLPFEGEGIVRPVGLIHRRGVPLRGVVKRFIDLLGEDAERPASPVSS